MEFNVPPEMLRHLDSSGLMASEGGNVHPPLTDVNRMLTEMGMSGPTPKSRFAESISASEQMPNRAYSEHFDVPGVPSPFDPEVHPYLPTPTRGVDARRAKTYTNLNTRNARGEPIDAMSHSLSKLAHDGNVGFKPTIQRGLHASKTRWGMEFLPYNTMPHNVSGMQGPQGMSAEEYLNAAEELDKGVRRDPLSILAGKAKMAPTLLESRRSENTSKASTMRGSEEWIPGELPIVTNDLPPASGTPIQLGTGARMVNGGDFIDQLDNFGRSPAYQGGESRGANMLWHNLWGSGKYPGGGQPMLDSGTERTMWGQSERALDASGGLGGVGAGESKLEGNINSKLYHGMAKGRKPPKFKLGMNVHKIRYNKY